MSQINQEYLFSFTTGGLFLNESLVAVEKYAQLGDWKATLDAIQQDNAFQTRTTSTLKKRFREVQRRLEHLSNQQRQLLIDGTHDEQVAMIWLGICKAYRIIREFAVEFVRNRFLTMEWTVDPEDFDRFLDSKSVWDEAVDELADTTRYKLQQVVMLMLREAELVIGSIVQPRILSPATVEALQTDPEPLYRIFPVSDRDFGRLAG